MHFDVLDFEKKVPKKLLEFYIEKKEIESDRKSLITMYDSLNKDNSNLISKLYKDYCYAGKTAVNIFEEVTLQKDFLTKSKMKRILSKELKRKTIFNTEFRPPLTVEPQINWIEDRGDSILIQFVSKGKNRRIRNGYEIIEVAAIEFECAIVHFDGSPTIELRCAFNKHSKYLKCFNNYFSSEIEGEDTKKFEWIPITKVSNEEAEKVARKLSAGLVEADHKVDGIYDRNMVTASPNVKDLREQAEYIEQFKNDILFSQVLNVNYKEKTEYGEFESEIKFKINDSTGFQFLSKVSEAAINYVMSVFIDIRREKEVEEVNLGESG